MRTRTKGNYCLTAIALGVSVRQGAHFFIRHIGCQPFLTAEILSADRIPDPGQLFRGRLTGRP